jgi:hypothetical protein
MDDMQTFERRVASEVIGGMGPSEPVDDAAIFSAITTVTRSRSWRFPSLFSLTKSVAAGAIVALFGGFLLAGVLTTQPSDEQTPAVGASASGSSTPEATASVEASPNNDQVDREATTVRSDLVPGVDLVTEEVEQGVLRIISDGAGHDLDETHPSDRYDMNGIAVTPDGTVWLTTAYSGGDNDVQPTGPLVWALGRPGIYTTEDGVPEDGHTLVTESDGTLLMVGSTSSGGNLAYHHIALTAAKKSCAAAPLGKSFRQTTRVVFASVSPARISMASTSVSVRGQNSSL